jgi:hypothetical protein
MRSSLVVCMLAVFSLGFAPAPESRDARAFVEKFTTAMKDATKGYGRFVYEATNPACKAEVSDGKLRLLGDHDEGDQRLVIAAPKVFGKPRWPDSLEVTTRVGGTGVDSGAWHVGVSVGAVKVLFHPGFRGGAFRTEEVGTHRELSNNEDLGFTPAGDVTHPLSIKVQRAGEVYRFEVELTDAKGGKTFRKTFQFTDKQMGEFDRIGLERSGRRGGDALFETITIRRGK